MPPRRLPSLKGLQAFEAYARSGSMTRAGEDLRVTHGAVSRQIKSLELQLGAKLLSGKKHNLVMTPAGRELAAGLKGAFAMIEAALPGADRGGSLVVSCPATFAMKWLIPRLPNFAALHPEVSVRLVEPSGPIDFSGGEYQCAIVLSDERPPPGQQAKSF